MDERSEVTSEQQLAQLLEEGRITEEEYQQLRDTMTSKDRAATADIHHQFERSTQVPRTRLGICALVLTLIGAVAPILFFLLFALLFRVGVNIGVLLPTILAGPGILLLLAFILGLLSWSSGFGKVATILSPMVAVSYGCIIVVLGAVLIGRPVRVEAQEPAPKMWTHEEQRKNLFQETFNVPVQIISDGGATVIQPKDISQGGNGLLEIRAEDDATVHLFEVRDFDVDSAQLLYEAVVSTENLEGKAYLEMWCTFSSTSDFWDRGGGGGEFFSRDIQTPVLGTCDMRTESTQFLLGPGDHCTSAKLNLVIEGTGTVRIKEIKLTYAPMTW